MLLAMLRENMEKWQEKMVEQGVALGARKANIQTLTNLLTLKFGDWSRDYSSRIYAADDEQLGVWICRMLDAKRINEVFAEQ
jgi:hypothetical protein